VCRPAEPSFGHGAAGLWTMLFIFSKVRSRESRNRRQKAGEMDV
jgi:hypothetical protein